MFFTVVVLSIPILTLLECIWFLAPTVALCLQQCKALQEQIRSIQIRSLTSEDSVDKWSTKQLWDDVLKDIRIAVATYAVLRDALCHRFVQMESIALIVIDEGRCQRSVLQYASFANEVI